MQTYIALLRGINVSGQKLIKMAELKKALEDLMLINVRTYIQSGNVVFAEKSRSAEKLVTLIRKEIMDTFGFDVPVTVLSLEELSAFIKGNPFLGKRKEDITKLHLSILSAEPQKEEIDSIRNIKYDPDEFILKGRGVYLFCPNGYGNTKLTNTFFENKLKVSATTRNWKTIMELERMAAMEM